MLKAMITPPPQWGEYSLKKLLVVRKMFLS